MTGGMNDTWIMMLKDLLDLFSVSVVVALLKKGTRFVHHKKVQCSCNQLRVTGRKQCWPERSLTKLSEVAGWTERPVSERQSVTMNLINRD